MGARGWLLQRSMRWLPDPGLATRSPSPTPSSCRSSPAASAPGSGLPLGKFPSLFALQHRPGAGDPTVGALARQPCPAWGRSRQGPFTGGSGTFHGVLGGLPAQCDESCCPHNLPNKPPRFHAGEKPCASIEAAALNIPAENRGFPWLARAQPGGHFHSQAINLANGGF